eukprot:CAMPEP_0205854176 /NCGR_PEP_ID=MMETSP1083-20121108/1946_1 /ASSEMBLY_ACC=CAM_ASM_000430 /TAXON_ID=97485 /ORGANISM="Prymnesium parvum, Strain Texoma1" /LENGTH=43 /DNA_ID= /DNA_START= /DNA_END= /DNA_ORIENTATION=
MRTSQASSGRDATAASISASLTSWSARQTSSAAAALTSGFFVS